MDEDTIIINKNVRNEKIKNFFEDNKKILFTILILILISILIFFGYSDYKERKIIKVSDEYNLIITEYSESTKEKTKNALIKLININDSTYSPLSLYFIIDNKLITDNSEMDRLFEKVINDTPLEKEIQNLIIYKKALYYADSIEESELLEIVKPLINSNSIWKSHALYLVAEYFYSKNEKQKSMEFFNQILLLENANLDLKRESQRRLNRDLSE